MLDLVMLGICDIVAIYRGIQKWTEKCRSQFGISNRLFDGQGRSFQGRKIPNAMQVVSGSVGGIPVRALPDTGAQGNFISKKFGRQLGYSTDFKTESPESFQLVNGRKMKSWGQLQLPWKFSNESNTTYSLTFHVLDNGLEDVIIGNSFLKETETLGLNSHRLSERPIQNYDRYRIWNVGTPNQRLPGLLDNLKVSAFADTGCQLNIMSEAYARALGYDIITLDDQRIVFELPDGSTVPSPGYIEARWAFEDCAGKETLIYFDVMPNSTYDIVLGGDVLFKNKIFGDFTHRIVPGIPISELPEFHLVDFFIERRRKHQLGTH
jgi:hypothetical protein